MIHIHSIKYSVIIICIKSVVMKVTLEDINNVVRSINKLFYDRKKEKEKQLIDSNFTTEPVSSNNKYTLTTTDAENMSNSKAAILGLIHLKRLDVGSENGVKIYKVIQKM